MATRTWRGNTYRFTVTAANATAGATYTNNGQTFTVTDTITGGTILYATGTGAPLASGTLTKASGTGDVTITYSANTAPSVNYNVATNWLENAVPTNADAVVTGVFSGNMTINVASSAASVDFTGYTGTLTMSNSWVIGASGVAGGDFKLAAGMTVSGTGVLNILGSTATLTSAGVTWTGGIYLNSGNPSITVTLADSWTVNGTYQQTGNGAKTINNNILNIGGDVTASQNLTLGGTATFTFSGSSNQSCSGITFALPVNINKSGGTLTLGSIGANNNFTRTLGAVSVTAGTTLTIGASCTLTTSGITWANVTMNAAGTITLGSSLTVNELLTISNSITFSGAQNITTVSLSIVGTITVTLSGNITVSGLTSLGSTTSTSTINNNGSTRTIIAQGGITLAGTTAIVTGSANIQATGGTITGVSSVQLRNNLEIAGNVTFANGVTLFYNTGTFTYTSGTITSTGSTISCGVATPFTITGNNCSLNNLTFSAASTITVNGTGFTVGGTFTANGSITFAGTNGATIGTFTGTTGGLTHTFVSTRTYTITTLSVNGTAASPSLIKSSIGGSKAIITLTNASANYRLNVTDIDGSLGAAGITLGTVTTSFNWTGSLFLYYVGAANWSATTSWSPISGGAPITSISVPTSSDDVLFDANSVNSCTLNVAAVCKSINFTGYAQTLTLTNGITVSGNVTLAAGMTITGSGTLNVNATATLTSNGKQWSGGFTIASAATYTFADNWDIVGNVSVGISIISTIINGGKTITIRGSFTTGGNTSTGAITTFILAGTGTWSGGSASPNLFRGNVIINTVGTITLGASIAIDSTASFNSNITYTAGTVVTTGNTLYIYSLPVELNTNGIIWNNIFGQQGTIILTSNLTCSGNYTSGNLGSTVNGAFNFTIGSNLLIQGTNVSTPCQGTANFIMNGTGSISMTNPASTCLANIPLNITGTITLSGNVNFGGANSTLTLTSNLIGSGTLTLVNNCTINGVANNSIPNLTFSNVSLTTTVTNDFTVTGNTTFSTITNTATINGVGRTITTQGSLTMSALTTGIVTGTANLKMTGTGNLSMNASVTTGYIATNLEIASSNVTIVNTIRYQTRIFKLSASPLGTGILSIINNASLDGGGFTIPNLYASTAGITITLISGIVISSSFQSMSATSASRVLFTSNSGGVQRKLTLNYSGTQYIMYTNATDIDSGDGQTIWSFGSPTLTNTINWNELKAPVTRGFIRG